MTDPTVAPPADPPAAAADPPAAPADRVAPPVDPDESRRRTEERIRAMQFDQFPVEGGEAKQRVGMFSAYLVSTLAAVLPIRVRTAFAFGLNFVYNNFRATLVLLGAWLSRGVTGGAIFFVYWAVIGPTALLARLFGRDDLRLRPVQGSMFTKKEPPDDSEERFLRQF
jgi:hypothetical protein